jgi:hypothetical protein
VEQTATVDPFAAGAVARSVTSDDSRIASGEDGRSATMGVLHISIIRGWICDDQNIDHVECVVL